MIVIVGASDAELRGVRNLIARKRTEAHGGSVFLFGELRGWDVCLVKTGVGRKKAGATARAIAARLKPKVVLVLGAAGALDPELEIGSVLIIDQIRAQFGASLACDDTLCRRAFAAVQASGMRPLTGSCLQMRRFIHRAAEKQLLRTQTGTAVVDMESAALGTAFQHSGIPFVNIRIVSDAACADTADMNQLVQLRFRQGFAAALLWLLVRPRELVRALRFYRAMAAVRGRIAAAAVALAAEFAKDTGV